MRATAEITTTESNRLKTVSPATRYPSGPSKQSQPLTTNHVEQKKKCRGECVGDLIALFCDGIDSEAFCPDDGSCCMTNGAEPNDNKNSVATTRRPTTYQPPTTPPAPRCPGFCLLNIMAAFCERPSVLISRTSNCKQGSVCCDNSRAVTTTKPKPQPTRRPITTTTTMAPMTAAPDPRSECPGTCIVSLLSFTCFR